AIARRQSHAGPRCIGFEQGDAARLPFAAGQFDGVTCMRLYHRIDSPLRLEMMSEVRRVGRGWAILFFGMTSPWLALSRQMRPALGGRPTSPIRLTTEHIR